MMEPLLGYYLQPQSPRHIEDSIMNSIMKAQFQQKQMQEKEHKLLQMLDNQQQLAMQKAGLNGVLPSKYSNNAYNASLNGTSTPNSFQPGKVRQMFEERRKGGGVGLPSNNLYNTSSNNGNSTPGYRSGGIVGIDKSYPLDPIVAPAGKSRSSSSKSDPNPATNAPSYLRNTRNAVNAKAAGGVVAPAASKRGISLDRTTPANRSRDGRESSFSTNGGPPLGFRRTNSGLSGSSYDDDMGHSNRGGHDTRSTTKYSEIYGNGQKSPSPEMTLAQREANLANKMKKLSVRDEVQSSESKTSVVSNPPAKRPVPPPRTKAPTPPVRSSKSVTPKKTVSNAKSPPPARGPPPPGLEECKICGRFFASDRIAKHETICKKTSTKKRKVFDPTKMRMQGTEAEPYIRKVSAKTTTVRKDTSSGAKKADWRKKHEEFIKTIRAAKEYQAHVAKGGNPADLPPPPPTDTSDYVQCPYCGRKFSEGAAERHIPKCKNIKSNKR